jgi:hypothetical protein
MPRAATVPTVLLVVAGCLLAGCGSSANPYALPKYDGASAGATAPARPGPSQRPVSRASKVRPMASPPPEVKYSPADAWGEGAWVESGAIRVHSARQRAVVEAMTKYLALRVELSNTWQVDERALAAVASGEAVSTARARAELQRARKWHSVGRFVVNVSSVKINGSDASVTGCHFDATSEVDQNGGPVISPPGGVLITMKLHKSGETWRVVDWPQRPAPFCDWRA